MGTIPFPDIIAFLFFCARFHQRHSYSAGPHGLDHVVLFRADRRTVGFAVSELGLQARGRDCAERRPPVHVPPPKAGAHDGAVVDGCGGGNRHFRHGPRGRDYLQ